MLRTKQLDGTGTCQHDVVFIGQQGFRIPFQQMEVEELEEATVDAAPERVEEELGDVLFTIVNLARFLKIDPEIALTAANRKFKRRFSYIENKVKEKQQKWEQLSLLDLDDLWQEAKMLEEDA